jgi:hypothetical protein
MATSKKGSQKESKPAARKRSRKASRRFDPRAPWKQSWYVLWGFVTVVGELILIFLVKGKVFSLSIVQIVVIFVCIPLIAHLLVSAFRSILVAISIGEDS